MKNHPSFPRSWFLHQLYMAWQQIRNRTASTQREIRNRRTDHWRLGSFDASGYMDLTLCQLQLSVWIKPGDYRLLLSRTWVFRLFRFYGSHAFELSAGYTLKVWAECNYILNEAGGAASAGGDLYFQAGYAFKYASVFLGAGKAAHIDGDFAVCNIGVGHKND